jgi:hypothetical protein
MTDGRRQVTTSVSISNWTTQHNAPRVVSKSDTNGALTQDVVLISGRLISTRGANEVLISVEPATIDRKLAIRNLNRTLQGGTAKSNTASRGS